MLVPHGWNWCWNAVAKDQHFDFKKRLSSISRFKYTKTMPGITVQLY